MADTITSETAVAFVRRERAIFTFIQDKVFGLLRELPASRLSEWESRFVHSILASQGQHLTPNQYRAAVKIIATKHGRFRGYDAKGVNRWLNQLAERVHPQASPGGS